jgi:membrane associated rhomboid family serine protease
MFLPLGDDNSNFTIKPYVNWALIIINILVFVFLQGAGSTEAGTLFTYSYSTVPAEILSGTDIITKAGEYYDERIMENITVPPLGETPIPIYLTLFTACFMHGGWGHLLGNMLYLYIFGDNIENRLGHVKYLVFYLLTGLIASLSHVISVKFLQTNPLIPCLGASGAISGILGAYLILFPKTPIKVLVFVMIMQIPALIALGGWIALQIINGLGMLGGRGDGVAYAAHIGGFLAGMFLIKFFDRQRDNADQQNVFKIYRRP